MAMLMFVQPPVCKPSPGIVMVTERHWNYAGLYRRRAYSQRGWIQVLERTYAQSARKTDCKSPKAAERCHELLQIDKDHIVRL